jgi:hypothetical protein
MESVIEEIRASKDSFDKAMRLTEEALNMAEECADYRDFLEKTLIERTGMTKTEIFKLWCRERAEA